MSQTVAHPASRMKGLQQSAPRDVEASGVLIEKAATSPMDIDDTSPVPTGTDLYRFYDRDDQLLYVGISLHAAMRASQHKSDKPWWPDMERMHVEHPNGTRATRQERQHLDRESGR